MVSLDSRTSRHLDATPGNKPTILVDDDEQLIRWSLTERSTQESYRLLEAETASEALARQREGRGLGLLDYRQRMRSLFRVGTSRQLLSCECFGGPDYGNCEGHTGG